MRNSFAAFSALPRFAIVIVNLVSSSALASLSLLSFGALCLAPVFLAAFFLSREAFSEYSVPVSTALRKAFNAFALVLAATLPVKREAMKALANGHVLASPTVAFFVCRFLAIALNASLLFTSARFSAPASLANLISASVAT